MIYPNYSKQFKTMSTELAAIPSQINLAVLPKADKTELQAIASGSPKGIYASLTDLQTAFPLGNTNVYLIPGTDGTQEVDTLTVTAIPTVAGNLSITLNGVTKTVAVDPSTDTTTTLVATKIRAVTFTGWTIGGTGANVIYTKTTVGTNTPVVFNAGTTGVTATFTLTTAGVASTTSDWYYWSGSVWADGGVYQAKGSPSEVILARINSIGLCNDLVGLRLDNLENYIETGGWNIKNAFVWEKGTMNTGSGANSTSDYKYRTKNPVAIPFTEIKVNIPLYNTLYAFKYSADGLTFQSYKSYASNVYSITLETNFTYRFAIHGADSSTLADLNNLLMVYGENAYTSLISSEAFIKELYIVNPQNIDLKLYIVRRNYSTNNEYRITITDLSNNIVALYLVLGTREDGIVKIPEYNASGIFGYAIVDWTLIPDTTQVTYNATLKDTCFTLDNQKRIISYFDNASSKMLDLGLNSSNLLKTASAKPIVTLIDDDTSYTSIPNIKTICDTLGIKCTFACITDLLSSNGLLAMLQGYQHEGYHITTHSETHGDIWNSASGSYSVAECEKEIIDSIVTLKENGFLDCDYLITPFGTATTELQAKAKKWAKCLVSSADTTANHLCQDGRYNIRRVNITYANTLDYYTALIDSAYANGDWLIFYTHSADGTQFDATLTQNVLQYAITKGIDIMTLNEAMKQRKPVYDYYEMYS